MINMDERGFWEPIIFILAISLILIFFGTMIVSIMSYTKDSQTTINSMATRQKNKIETDFDVYTKTGEMITAGYSSGYGFWIKNEGNSNLHNIDIYWSSPSSSTLCYLKDLALIQTTIDDFKRGSNYSHVDYTTTPGSVILDKNGSVYYSSGSFESYPMASGEDVNWTYIWADGTGSWPGQVYKFQLRSAATHSALSSATYVGPDSTPATYYTPVSTDVIAGHDNNPWIQYKAYLSTDDVNQTPEIQAVKILFRLPAESHGIQELLRGQSIIAFPSDDADLCTGVTLYGDHVASQDAITIKTVNESRVRYVP